MVPTMSYGYDRKVKPPQPPCEHRHTDNQGLCWRCGIVLNQDWYDAYMGVRATIWRRIGEEKTERLKELRTW